MRRAFLLQPGEKGFLVEETFLQDKRGAVYLILPGKGSGGRFFHWRNGAKTGKKKRRDFSTREGKKKRKKNEEEHSNLITKKNKTSGLKGIFSEKREKTYFSLELSGEEPLLRKEKKREGERGTLST